MQTFIVKLGCLLLFGFIFFSAYQLSSSHTIPSTNIEPLPLPKTILVSTKDDLTNDAEIKAAAQALQLQVPVIKIN